MRFSSCLFLVLRAITKCGLSLTVLTSTAESLVSLYTKSLHLNDLAVRSRAFLRGSHLSLLVHKGKRDVSNESDRDGVRVPTLLL